MSMDNESLIPESVFFWPEKPFTIHGCMILSINNINILRINQPLEFPGLKRDQLKDLDVKLRSIRYGEIRYIDNLTSENGINWILDNTKQFVNDDILQLNKVKEFNMADYFAQVSYMLTTGTPARMEKIKSKNSFGAGIKNDLRSSPNTRYFNQSAKSEFLSCMQFITNDSDCLEPSADKTSEYSFTHLINLLDANKFSSREVIINLNDLSYNCGVLLGFTEEDGAKLAALKFKHGAYWIWIPDVMDTPKPLSVLQKNDDFILSPRMISVGEQFVDKDLSSLGLLRFAYGQPKSTVQYIIVGSLIGLILGFTFSIGREVGAARWMLALTFAGGIVGTSLGLLSGPLRTAAALMLAATSLSMLTPTFNTIITNQALPDRDLALLLQIGAILIIAGILRISIDWVQSREVLIAEQQAGQKSQAASIARLMSLPVEFFRKRNVGELQLRFSALDELRGEVQQLLDGGVFKAGLTSIYILFMLRISVKLTALAIFISLLILIPTLLAAIQARPLQRKQEESEAQAQSRNLEIIRSVSKLRLAGAENAATKWWAEEYRKIIVLEDRIDQKEAITTLLQTIIPNLGNLLIFIVVTRLMVEAANNNSFVAPNVGELLGFFSAFGTFIGAAASLASLLIGAFDLPIIYERAEPILKEAAEKKNYLDFNIELQGRIKIDRVSYRYDFGAPLSLDNVSMDIEQGEFIAIVGTSGSGKSTLARLLLGFDQPEDGSIYFDGRSLNSINIDCVRRQIGTVLQFSNVFSGSIFEAISGGAALDEEQIWQAAELAGLADDIREMPMGLHTVIPDGGGTLSGGQRQRISIARALARKPKILIFDEATSALDNRTQTIVSNNLESLNVTRIIIAHRLSTIKKADKIFLLDNGMLKETGTFTSLTRDRGQFFKLMERQV